mgnify:CR=1 FL=1
MHPEKRRLIVREIERWRRSRLLPEQYCDFLLNLYADELAAGASGVRSRAAEAIENSHWKYWLFGVLGLAAIAMLAIHFNDFPLPMQISTAALPLLAAFAAAHVYRSAKPVLAHVCAGAGNVLLLLLGPYFINAHGPADSHWIGVYIGVCSLLWIVQGIVWRMGLFHFCGWIGLVLVYAWSVQVSFTDLLWIHAQLMWIPLAVLFAWFAWLFHRKNKGVSRIFMAVAAVQWFVPDVLAFVLHGAGAWEQVGLVIKIVAAGALLYVSRKHWVVWIA